MHRPKKYVLILLLTVLGFCGLGVLAMVIPGLTTKAAGSALDSLMPGNKQMSKHLWLVPDSIDDGDTLRVTDGSKETEIELCGTDAPEPYQPMADTARDHLRNLVAVGNGAVIVVPIKKNREGQTLADVFVADANDNEIHLNSQMIMDGMAYHYEQESDSCPQPDVLAMAEEIAKEQSVGVWVIPDAQKPWQYRQTNK
ncbi:MAG: thermonuclease family protein [Cyanobacteria bacterium J06649_5]